MPQYNTLPTSPPCAASVWWALGNCFCVTVDFDLTEAAPVTTQITTLQGKVVYSNAAGVLAAGHYTLPIQTQQISAGYYVVMVKYGKQVKSTKIVKL